MSFNSNIYDRLSVLCLLMLILLCGYGGGVQAACSTSMVASTPTTDFVVHSNGTLTHTKTGLMWKQCSEGQTGATCTGAATGYTWQAALTHVQTLNNGGGFAGHVDWRVPNVKELASIIEEQCSAPAVNIAVFPATVATSYWSSSPDTANANAAWDVSFSGGSHGSLTKTSALNLRLVRGGF